MVNVHPYFSSKKGNFVPLVIPYTSNDRFMGLYLKVTLKRCDQVHYFYISFDLREAIIYFNKFKTSFLEIFEIFKKNQKTY